MELVRMLALKRYLVFLMLLECYQVMMLGRSSASKIGQLIFVASSSHVLHVFDIQFSCILE
jgi:hypothetical protein